MGVNAVRFLAICFLVVYFSGLHAQDFYTNIGEAFPDFSIVDIENNKISNATLKGQPSLLVFFGTRCRSCLKELKALDERIPSDWYDKMNIYAVGSTDTKSQLIEFNSYMEYEFGYLPDPEQKLFDRVAEHTLPRTFLLDKNGKIISQTKGFNKTPFENLLSRIEDSL